METTYREMTVEHLGSDATELDLAAFKLACSLQAEGTDAEATEYFWNNGDWVTRVADVVPACTYCGNWTLSEESYVPDINDDEGWARLAEAHEPDCEWIATRAHNRFEEEN